MQQAAEIVELQAEAALDSHVAAGVVNECKGANIDSLRSFLTDATTAEWKGAPAFFSTSCLELRTLQSDELLSACLLVCLLGRYEPRTEEGRETECWPR